MTSETLTMLDIGIYDTELEDSEGMEQDLRS
jgi:hypothetical protein